MRALPLPLGEVPEAERVIFALSVGFAASSPRVGAKGERIVTGGNPRRGPRQCALVRNDMRFSTLHTLSTIVPKGHRFYSPFPIP